MLMASALVPLQSLCFASSSKHFPLNISVVSQISTSSYSSAKNAHPLKLQHPPRASSEGVLSLITFFIFSISVLHGFFGQWVAVGLTIQLLAMLNSAFMGCFPVWVLVEYDIEFSLLACFITEYNNSGSSYLEWNRPKGPLHRSNNDM